jgi:phosphate transport system permease protein
MSILMLMAVVIALAVMAYVVCRAKAVAGVQGDIRGLHSLPGAYGWHGAIMVLLPAFAVMAVWLVVQPLVIQNRVSGFLADMPADAQSLAMMDVRRLAAGLDQAMAAGKMAEADIAGPDVKAKLADAGVALGAEIEPSVLLAAQSYRAQAAWGRVALTLATLAAAIAGFAVAFGLTKPLFRARNRVEHVIMGLLIAASSVAILTTVGIVFSMLTETFHFFQAYPIQDFFFGLTWDPNFKGDSDFGIIPLIWGTMYITLIAMLIAVPLGLFSAIYLAEYATPRTRSIVKPLIEVIAGIPTVVFGLFALVTVGPFLRDWIAQPFGWGDSGSSVMTAGLVIGILNIPFVSSLSDDIINSVPQSMRDGSYGLGATKSETIRQVVLPAALPGIMGAVLMAGSRAIGETMIVSMGAGAAARLDMNPFQAMTTITVKIVSQLTGDTDFASPETLVAFALGMTLFVITLGLNILALTVVRKYREQYE